MRAVALLALLALHAAALQDLGAPGFTCPLEVMKKSATVPSSAHSVRWADIEIIGALGDSLTAANGAGAEENDPLAILIQYRGLTFSVGGDKTLDEHVSLANIMKRFNPDIFGYSIGQGSADNWQRARLNAGIPGAHSFDLPGQAQDLIRRLKEHHETNYENKWKLIHIFIGGNDMCRYCDKPTIEDANDFIKKIQEAVQYLKDNLTRTIVVLTGMFDMSMLRKIDHNDEFCQGLHLAECHCESNTNFTDAEIQDACRQYMAKELDLQNSGVFDDRDDFTFVVQPFFNDITDPPTKPDGSVNLEFFAADCFHFAQLGHAVTAKNLWNNLLEPVGKKTTKGELTNYNFALNCPDAACPFVRTTKNSADCTKYQTPSE